MEHHQNIIGDQGISRCMTPPLPQNFAENKGGHTGFGVGHKGKISDPEKQGGHREGGSYSVIPPDFTKNVGNS